MSCRICGRSSCTESFHSLDEQEIYEMSIEELRSEVIDLRFTVKNLNKIINKLDLDQ